tara:strand:+ start:67561 stop:67854 length:294 start_codon:yes stop_codon:yes gene_type:complete
MSLSDRFYAEANIDTRLQYRFFKNKCNQDMNKENEPDGAMTCCTTWDYGVMEKSWKYSTITYKTPLINMPIETHMKIRVFREHFHQHQFHYFTMKAI